MSQPCPASGMTVGKSIQEKSCLLKSVTRLKLLTNLILQKCSLQEGVHKRGHICFKEKKNCVSKCWLQGQGSEGCWIQSVVVLMKAMVEVFKLKEKVKGRQHKICGGSSRNLQGCRGLGGQAWMLTKKGAGWGSGYNTTGFTLTPLTAICSTEVIKQTRENNSLCVGSFKMMMMI